MSALSFLTTIFVSVNTTITNTSTYISTIVLPSLPPFFPPFFLTFGSLMATIMWASDAPDSKNTMRPKLVLPIMILLTPITGTIDVILLPIIITYNTIMYFKQKISDIKGT